jgi:adenosylmethionine-8-amino-7-oxononanoate aminotransferase
MSNAIWHPMTQHKIFTEMVEVERAEGAYIFTKDGRQIIDGISSWWLNTHGHCHPKIVEAVQAQAGKLDQVIFAGFTHEPAEELADRLLGMTGEALQHVFFSDSGSTAIEIALKMAIGYFEQTGNPRKKIVALEGGYHGDTFGAMSTGERNVFNEIYQPYLFDVAHIPFPEGDGSNAVKAFEELLVGGDVAALILEPIVQGAAGMRIYSGETLKALDDLCKKHGALLIADEVMTGFGRTGNLFACDEAGVTPDLMCLSKGITGGYLPMGVTLATKEIYNAFYHDDRAKQFFHSTSFTGNPLACAAANAALQIWDDEPVRENIARIASMHEKAAARFRAHEDVMEVRTKGTIFAMDIKDPTNGYLSNLGVTLYNYFLSHDVLLRPIGNTVYILPPYCIKDEELETIYERIERSLDYIRNGGEQRAA